MCNMSDAAQIMRLSDLAHIRAGHPFRGALEAVAEGSVTVAQMKDILPGGGVDWSSAVRTAASSANPYRNAAKGWPRATSTSPRK